MAAPSRALKRIHVVISNNGTEQQKLGACGLLELPTTLLAMIMSHLYLLEHCYFAVTCHAIHNISTRSDAVPANGCYILRHLSDQDRDQQLLHLIPYRPVHISVTTLDSTVIDTLSQMVSLRHLSVGELEIQEDVVPFASQLHSLTIDSLLSPLTSPSWQLDQLQSLTLNYLEHASTFPNSLTSLTLHTHIKWKHIENLTKLQSLTFPTDSATSCDLLAFPSLTYFDARRHLSDGLYIRRASDLHPKFASRSLQQLYGLRFFVPLSLSILCDRFPSLTKLDLGLDVNGHGSDLDQLMIHLKLKYLSLHVSCIAALKQVSVVSSVLRSLTLDFTLTCDMISIIGHNRLSQLTQLNIIGFHRELSTHVSFKGSFIQYHWPKLRSSSITVMGPYWNHDCAIYLSSVIKALSSPCVPLSRGHHHHNVYHHHSSIHNNDNDDGDDDFEKKKTAGSDACTQLRDDLHMDIYRILPKDLELELGDMTPRTAAVYCAEEARQVTQVLLHAGVLLPFRVPFLD